MSGGQRKEREKIDQRGQESLGSGGRPGVEAGADTGHLGRRCGGEAGTSSHGLIFRKKEFQGRD